MTSTSVTTRHTSGQPLKSVELSWDQFASGDFPANVTPAAESYFLTALGVTMQRALHQLPDTLHSRLSKAHEIVLAGHVLPLEGGEYDVTSQSTKGEKAYRVNGACECLDYTKAPEVKGIFCKHKLASALYQRASEGATQALEHDLNGKPASGQIDTTPLPEAPASVNTFVEIDGHKVQVTLRGTDVSRLLSQISEVIAQRPHVSQEQTHAEGWCSIHQEQMKQSKDGKGYYHKAGEKADGKALWCRGK